MNILVSLRASLEEFVAVCVLLASLLPLASLFVATLLTWAAKEQK